MFIYKDRLLKLNFKSLVLLILIPTMVLASDGTFAWDQNTEPDIEGYRIYYRETSGGDNILLYDTKHPNDNLTVYNTPVGYYVAKAYDIYDNESEDSEEILIAGYYYNTTRYDYESGSNMLIYKGEHTDHDADISDVNWVITKYFYSGNILSYIRIRTTSWSNRAIGW